LSVAASGVRIDPLQPQFMFDDPVQHHRASRRDANGLSFSTIPAGEGDRQHLSQNAWLTAHRHELVLGHFHDHDVVRDA